MGGHELGKAKKRRGLPTYFFLDVEDKGPLLHRLITMNRGKDTVTTWCYSMGKRVVYSFTFVNAHKQTAFNTNDVARMLNRSKRQIYRIMKEEKIPSPEPIMTSTGRVRGYMWHEKDILNAHEVLSNAYRSGRMKKDGTAPVVSPMATVTPRELRALIRQEQIMYIKDPTTGEFVPVWKAKDFS